jgi:hypothetical protein
MPSLLWCGEQAFWVSNSAKDLLYEVSVGVAERCDPAARQRLAEDGRLLGCYGVSGVGFELEAFEQAFGGAAAWQEAVIRHFDVVEELCGNPECVRHMTKLFAWAWFLLRGGQCNGAAGDHPDLSRLPEQPGAVNPPEGT